MTSEILARYHERKQDHADGFQAGWHAALQRVSEGDSVTELRDLVPDTAPAYRAERDRLAAEVKRLRAATTWQPIETAPKDGTPVLLFVPSSEECVVAACISHTWYSTYWQDEFLDDPSHWAHLPAAPYAPKTGTHVPEIETKDIAGPSPDDQERAWQYASRVCAAFVGSQHGNARRLGPMSICIRCAGPLYRHWLRQALVALRTK